VRNISAVIRQTYPIKHKRLQKSVMVPWKWYAVFLHRIFCEGGNGAMKGRLDRSINKPDGSQRDDSRGIAFD